MDKIPYFLHLISEYVNGTFSKEKEKANFICFYSYGVPKRMM